MMDNRGVIMIGTSRDSAVQILMTKSVEIQLPAVARLFPYSDIVVEFVIAALALAFSYAAAVSLSPTLVPTPTSTIAVTPITLADPQLRVVELKAFAVL